MKDSKIYIGGSSSNTNMLPGDPLGSPDESFSKEAIND